MTPRKNRPNEVNVLADEFWEEWEAGALTDEDRAAADERTTESLFESALPDKELPDDKRFASNSSVG